MTNLKKAVEQAREDEKKRIGKELWKWFYGKNFEMIESAIERITGVEDTKQKK